MLERETMSITLSSKGQLVIPKAIRQALGLRAGTRFHVRVVRDQIVLEPLAPSPIAALYGRYAKADLLADLEAEHRQEIEDDVALRA
jgi:AbrB family looped-hinge helix DNA binding protein